jgi:trigger factor
MAYTVENLNDCTKRINFNFESVDLSTQIEEALKEKQKTSNLKGFRKGKAPLDMIKQLYGAQLENDALHRFISSEFFKAIQEADIRAIGYPTFANTKYEDSNVTFEATVEIFPDFEIADYSKYSFTKDNDKIEDKDYEELEKRYLESKAEMKELTDESATLATGQFAVMNFVGEKEDGSKPENMKAEEFVLEIGSGQFIPGFEDGMIGMKKAEKKTIELTFPAEYHEPELQNAPVKFHVELLEIKEKTFPSLDDELAKEFGFDSAEDFQTKNKSRLETQKQREVQAKLQQDILEKLVADNSFDVPKTMIDQQKESVKQELAHNLKQQGFTDQMVDQYFEKWDSDVTSKAEFQVRSGLILDKLAKKYNVESTEEDFASKLDEMAEQSGMEKDQITSYYSSNEQIKNNLMYAIREEKTFEKIISDVTVK